MLGCWAPRSQYQALPATLPGVGTGDLQAQGQGQRGPPDHSYVSGRLWALCFGLLIMAANKVNSQSPSCNPPTRNNFQHGLGLCASEHSSTAGPPRTQTTPASSQHPYGNPLNAARFLGCRAPMHVKGASLFLSKGVRKGLPPSPVSTLLLAKTPSMHWPHLDRSEPLLHHTEPC